MCEHLFQFLLFKPNAWKFAASSNSLAWHIVSTQETLTELELNLACEGLEAVLAAAMWMGI